MHQTYDIVVGLAGLIVALALVGGGLVYMLKKSEAPGKLLLKLLFTVPFVCGCLWLAPKMFIWGPFLIVFMAVVLSYLWTPSHR